MSWIRQKPSEQVQADALAMVRRKQDEGCSPCAQAYADLARRHGASNDEVERALRQGSSESDVPRG